MIIVSVKKVISKVTLNQVKIHLDIDEIQPCSFDTGYPSETKTLLTGSHIQQKQTMFGIGKRWLCYRYNGEFILICEYIGGTSSVAIPVTSVNVVEQSSVIAADGAMMAVLGDYSGWPSGDTTTRNNSYTDGRTKNELDKLAEDPAHANSTRAIDIEKCIDEAKIGLDLKDRKIFKGDPTGDAEFIDAKGQAWDIKGFNSYAKIKKGVYTLEGSMDAINKSFKNDENVILNTTKLNAEDK